MTIDQSIIEKVKIRDPFWDNAKFILIVLVILGHFLQIFLYNEVLKSLYIFIYSFHIPAFVLISGYFSKKIYFDKKDLVSKILIPFIIFHFIYSAIVYGENISIVIPFAFLWYLLCIFIWKISLPYLLKLKHPLLFSFILSLVAGAFFASFGYYFSLSRLIYFLPYFLLGYFFQKEDIKKIVFGKKIMWYIIAYVLVMITFIVSVFFNINVDWLYGSYSYQHFGFDVGLGIIFRILLYIISILMIIVFLNLVPNKNTIYTKFGSNTLYVLILHGFFILILRTYFVKYLLPYDTLVVFLLLFIFAVALAIVLSSDITKKISKFLIEPRINWLFVKK